MDGPAGGCNIQPGHQCISQKTYDVYNVDKNLPARFNNPDCFKGYNNKQKNLRYLTTNQTYGSTRPSVHEMPTIFRVSSRKASEAQLRRGMYHDNSFNTSLDKRIVTDPFTMAMFRNCNMRIHHVVRDNT